MCAQLLDNDTEDVALVEVYDRRDNRHLVEVELDDGSIGRHGQDAYPRSPEERTDEQERLMHETDIRAKYEAHTQTPHEILNPGWVPEQLERGIEAIEALPTDTFAEQFRDYYDALVDPDPLVDEYDIRATEFEADPEIALLHKGFCVDGDDRIASVVDGVYVYYSGPDTEESYGAGPAPRCPDGTTMLTTMLPPFETVADDFVYPEDFRDTLLNNLVCQARDVYRNMGEQPPERFDIDGFGKPTIVSELNWADGAPSKDT